MTRRVAPFDGAPSPQAWRVERRATYRRARGLALALLLLVLALVMVTVVGVASAVAAPHRTPAEHASDVAVDIGLLVVAALYVGFLLVTRLWRRRSDRDDR